ncbi:MAG: SUMF1/EgtB/PvdO family nonheme iron enzyme [Pseudomonadota bacterium]
MSEQRGVCGARRALALGLALALVLWAGAAPAQECPPPRGALAPKTPTLGKATNPNPNDLDIVLPMPGGGSMVFRHVCVPADGYLGDLKLNLGCTDCSRPELGFMEQRRQAHLTGGFILADLPQPWREKLANCAKAGDGRCPSPGDKTARGFYYFIGKYEVSRQQWEAIRRLGQAPAGGEAPAPGPDDARPVTNVSWFQVQQFAAAYTEWLLQQKDNPLPQFADERTAFLRLPTEAEWEYAARGGQKLSELQFNQEDMFPLHGKPLSDYAVYTDKGSSMLPEKPAWIGSRCANPLGLYDTAGNAGEMVGDLFHFTVRRRDHGGSGGFIIKGGSYLKTMAEALPGRREEMPFYLGKAPYKAEDLGFRLVIAGILTPRGRDQSLQGEWAKLGEQGGEAGGQGVLAKEMDHSQDPIVQIDRMLKVAGNDAEKKNLRYLRDAMKANNSVIAEQRAESAKGVIRTALFTAESMLNYAVRRKMIEFNIADLRAKTAQVTDPALRKQIQSQIARQEEGVKRMGEIINESLSFYLDRVKESGNYDQAMFQAQMMRISDELRSHDGLSQSFRQRWDVLARHIETHRTQPGKLTRTAALNEILPENLR